MKRFVPFLYILCLICAACNKKTSVMVNAIQHSKDVFLELPLPSPSSVRTGSGSPGIHYWQQQADHDIQVRLDVDSNTVIGSEKIIYQNNSPDTLPYIWLQLEQNTHREDSIRSREGRSSR